MKIILKNKGRETPQEVIDACSGDELAARLLFNRGIDTYKKVMETIDNSCYNPYDPKKIPNIEKAVDIIKGSLINKEKIAIYGDYDVDGVTATTILVSAIRKLGGQVIYHVPDRFTEGYGMNMEIVEQFYNEGIKTIITCDCGISNFNEIDRARELDIEVILTDHHTIGENIPNADVVINPKLLPDGHPAKDVSGCVTAYYLIKVLFEDYGREDAEEYLDLAALSIIADVIPLAGEARYLLRKGLPNIVNTKRIGMQALLKVINTDLKNEEDIAFQITPRINAAGRMDSARVAVDMFLSDDINDAFELATKINGFNVDRKTIQKDILDMAEEQVKNEKMNKKILVLYGDSWHHGIIGIVAGRICELYKKPCILLTLSEDGENIVGSARSTEDINIYEILDKHREYLLKFGGHSGAAGLSLEKNKLKEFTKQIENYSDIYIGDDENDKVYVDLKLKINEINEDILKSIDKLAPFGASFEKPIFYSQNIAVVSDRVLPAGHHFMILEDLDGSKINGVIWNGSKESLENRCYDLVYTIYKDCYNGNNEVKIKIEDIVLNENKETNDKTEFVNRIGVNIEKVVGEFKNATIFYEGPINFKPDLPTKGSEELEETEKLILYSLPKSRDELNNIVTITKASKVILNYSYIPDYNIYNFTKMYLGLVKNIIHNYSGLYSIKKIAKIMNIEEEFVITFSKFMVSHGYFTFSMENDNIYFDKSDSKKIQNNYLGKIVSRYLEEKQEYAKYNKK